MQCQSRAVQHEVVLGEKNCGGERLPNTSGELGILLLEVGGGEAEAAVGPDDVGGATVGVGVVDGRLIDTVRKGLG